VELVQPEKKTAGMREVKEVISAMQNSPTAGYLQELSLHERIMLAAVLKCVKKEGVEEVKWGDVSNSSNPTWLMFGWTLIPRSSWLGSAPTCHLHEYSDGRRRPDAEADVRGTQRSVGLSDRFTRHVDRGWSDGTEKACR